MIGIILGSQSDWEIMLNCSDKLEELGIDCEMVVASAHRDPDKVTNYIKDWEEAGYKIIIAAAGIVAMEKMIDRLSQDHSNARNLATGLSKIPGISVQLDRIETNLIFIQVNSSNHFEIAAELDKQGIKVGARSGGLWRLVTHNDVSSQDIEYSLEIITDTFKKMSD